MTVHKACGVAQRKTRKRNVRTMLELASYGKDAGRARIRAAELKGFSIEDSPFLAMSNDFSVQAKDAEPTAPAGLVKVDEKYLTEENGTEKSVLVGASYSGADFAHQRSEKRQITSFKVPEREYGLLLNGTEFLS